VPARRSFSEGGPAPYFRGADPAEVKHEYGIKTITEYPEENGYGAIILAVAHQKFMQINLKEHKEKGCVIYDVKGILDQTLTDGRL